MSDKNKLVVVEQKEVDFYGDGLTAVLVEAGNAKTDIYVPVRPICDLLGIDWAGQYRRLKRNAVLSEELMSVDLRSTDIEPSSRRPRTSEMVCLPLKRIAGFLFGINPDRVKPELKERVILYQRECYDVLDEAFREGRLTSDPNFEQLLQQEDNDAVQAYQIAMAVVKLARNQILIEKRLTGRLDAHEERLEEIEITLGDPDQFITPKQASQISQAVKAVAVVYGKKTKRNEFGGVYGELYRKFEVTAYKELPAKKFRDAMDWLTEWYQNLTNDEVPF